MRCEPRRPAGIIIIAGWFTILPVTLRNLQLSRRDAIRGRRAEVRGQRSEVRGQSKMRWVCGWFAGGRRCLGVRWQGGSRDTAFVRAKINQAYNRLPCVRKRRGAPLPAAVPDTSGLAVIQPGIASCNWNFKTKCALQLSARPAAADLLNLQRYPEF